METLISFAADFAAFIAAIFSFMWEEGIKGTYGFFIGAAASAFVWWVKVRFFGKRKILNGEHSSRVVFSRNEVKLKHGKRFLSFRTFGKPTLLDIYTDPALVAAIEKQAQNLPEGEVVVHFPRKEDQKFQERLTRDLINFASDKFNSPYLAQSINQPDHLQEIDLRLIPIYEQGADHKYVRVLMFTEEELDNLAEQVECGMHVNLEYHQLRIDTLKTVAKAWAVDKTKEKLATRFAPCKIYSI